jgi:hypothetical protein
MLHGTVHMMRCMHIASIDKQLEEMRGDAQPRKMHVWYVTARKVHVVGIKGDVDPEDMPGTLRVASSAPFATEVRQCSGSGCACVARQIYVCRSTLISIA